MELAMLIEAIKNHGSTVIDKLFCLQCINTVRARVENAKTVISRDFMMGKYHTHYFSDV